MANGAFTTAYDINFATYQAITTPDPDGQPRYLSYPSNFFQVIVVDECHRGSAKEASSWRRVLAHFASAIQIGLTATPLSTETVQTDEYFGERRILRLHRLVGSPCREWASLESACRAIAGKRLQPGCEKSE